MQIRPLAEADIPHLSDIDPTFVSEGYLHVEVDQSEGLNVGYRLVERSICPGEVAGDGSRYGSAEQAHIASTLNDGGLALVVEHEERVVGVLEVEARYWNNTASIWMLLLSPEARGKGVGQQLVEQAAAWAKERSFRALWLETQTNNLPACRFYAHCGFLLAGFDTMFYTNDDIERGEVALFWYLPL